MPFIPHTEDDVREMLASIGVASIDDLFDEIPKDLRSGGLTKVPEGLSEMEVTRLSITSPLWCGSWSVAASSILRTRHIKRKRAKARCNYCTNIRP
jgi:Glycine cleavage system P-protein